MSSSEVNTRKGRPPIPEREKAYRRAAEAVTLHTQLQTELKSMIGLSEDEYDTPRGKEIIALANERIQVSRGIEDAMTQSNELNTTVRTLRDKIKELHSILMDGAVSEPEVKSIKEQELALVAELNEIKAYLKELKVFRAEGNAAYNEMPELGFTSAEWDAIPEEEKKKELGRPKLSIEVRIIRAEREKEEALKELNDIEAKEGLPLSTESKLLNEKSSNDGDAENGGPQNDYLMEMDKLFRRLCDEIELIESGEAERQQEDKMKHARRSKQGNLLGRPMEDLDKKLARLRSEAASTISKIDEIEKTLTGLDAVCRDLRVYRDILKWAKRINFTAVDSVRGQVTELNALKKKINKMIGLRAKGKEGKRVSHKIHGYINLNNEFISKFNRFLINDGQEPMERVDLVGSPVAKQKDEVVAKAVEIEQEPSKEQSIEASVVTEDASHSSEMTLEQKPTVHDSEREEKVEAKPKADVITTVTQISRKKDYLIEPLADESVNIEDISQDEYQDVDMAMDEFPDIDSVLVQDESLAKKKSEEYSEAPRNQKNIEEKQRALSEMYHESQDDYQRLEAERKEREDRARAEQEEFKSVVAEFGLSFDGLELDYGGKDKKVG